MGYLIVRTLLSAVFLAAGTFHLLRPAFFLPIMPPFISWPIAAILVSGAVELAGGIALWIPHRTVQTGTGWLLFALLIAIFPANIYMAAANIRIHGVPSQPWMAWARLPLQPLLMAATLWVTRCWPWSQAHFRETGE